MLKRFFGEEPQLQLVESPGRWPLDLPLLMLSSQDAFTLADACEGVQIFGAPGSGKTSGSGAALARAYLAAGFGGLVCCATPEDRGMWQRWAAEAGRAHHLVIFDQDARWRFNFLDYELTRQGRGGGHVENLVHLFGVVMELVKGKVALDPANSFWDTAKDQLLRNAIAMIALARRPLTIATLCKFILSAPTSETFPTGGSDDDRAAAYARWAEGSLFYAIVGEAEARGDLTPREKNGLEAASRYWAEDYMVQADKMRTSIVATFTGMADILSHGLPWELLCTDTNLTPEFTLRHGAIVILDLPLEEFGEVGRIIQGVMKYLYQRAILRRTATDASRPCFIWADESQHFISSFDPKFQSACRKHRGCTVMLTQNISNYYMALGREAHDAADALLGNFQTKMFHANAGPTNQYAADLIGKAWRRMQSTGGSFPSGGDFQGNISTHQELHYKVEPAELTTLAKGGKANDGRVGAIIFQGGRIWQQSGDTWLQAIFRQG